MSEATKSEASEVRDDKDARKAEKKAAKKAAKEAEKAAKEAEKAAKKAAKEAEKAAKKAAKEAKRARELERGDANEGSGKVEFESSMARDEAIAYFSSIVDGLRAGTVGFQHGEDEVQFPELPEQLTISVAAARKSDKSRIEFQLSWRESARHRLTIVSDG